MLNEPNFFEKLHPYLSTLLHGNPVGALDEGLAFLASAKQIDNEAYEHQHKGSPFYWLGLSAFLAHDYQSAVFFFDAAVSEDIRNGANASKSDTPALKFIYLKGYTRRHAAQPIVKSIQSRLVQELAAYNKRPGQPVTHSNLTLDHIRKRFIGHVLNGQNKHLRTLATTLISFMLEWDHRTRLAQVGIAAGSPEPFFIHLFKGCLLFESLLKENPKKPPKGKPDLKTALNELSCELGLSGKIDIGARTFTSVLSTIAPNEPMTVAMIRTGKVRNTLGHNLGWPSSLDRGQYDLLAADIGASCFHAINSLYK
jgi:hypothetical protein